jgi:hypothetical protein
MRYIGTAAVACLLLAACAKAGGANSAAPANAAAVPTNSPPVNTLAVDAYAAKSPKLAQIFTPDILGANVAYLETITGPAFSSLGADRIYKVDGCGVIVGDAKGRIANIGIKGMSAHCSFPIAQYFASGYDHPVPNYPTFGDIRQGFGGGFDADCLTLCGNAADPVVTLSYEGSHADNFTNLYAAVTIGDGPELGPYEDWAGKLGAKYGRDYLVNGKYHTGDSMDDVAAKDFGGIHPDVIRVGQALPGGN